MSHLAINNLLPQDTKLFTTKTNLLLIAIS